MRLAPFKHSLADYAARPENNYLVLRLLAALAVIYGHSFALCDPSGQTDVMTRLLRFTYSGDLGVDVFFVISGFLVTASYLNRRHWPDFMKSRYLRIFPGLLACLLLTAFLLAPVVTSLPAMEFLRHWPPYDFVLRNLSLVKLRFDLPGVFEGQRDSAVNGSLWTLPAEFLLYILLGLFGATGLLLRKRWYGVFILALCIFATALSIKVPFFANKTMFLRLFVLFGTGSVLRVYSERIPLSSLLMLLLLVPAVACFHTAAFPYLFLGWLVYVTMWFAYVPNLHWFNRMGDYSYGLYIYAYPVQQTLRHYFPHILPLQMFPAATVVTLACAALSWHLVEEPALRLKRVRFREQLGKLLRRTPATGTSE